ncbi:MAG: LuxR family transcriptional regulator [Dehalococcoidia bacterium]|nr:MAG: LuxR family transcriptional regulator [Dehalococcoidia bacterium]
MPGHPATSRVRVGGRGRPAPGRAGIGHFGWFVVDPCGAPFQRQRRENHLDHPCVCTYHHVVYMRIVMTPPQQKHHPESVARAVSDRWAYHRTGDSAESVIVVGPRGAGQHRFLGALEARLRASKRYVSSLWVTPNRPPLLSSLMLAELLGAQDIEQPTATEVARRLRRAMRDLSNGGRPLVVLVHELQDLAAEDAAIISDLLCAPPGGSVLLVAAVAERRSDGTLWHPLRAFREQAQRADHCELIDFPTLSVEEVTAEVERRLGTGVASPRFIREVARATGGRLDDLDDCMQAIEQLDPRLRSELLAASRTLQALPARGGPSEHAAVLQQVLDESGRAVAAALGVWKDPATVEVVSALTGLGDTAVESALSDLAEHGVIEDVHTADSVVTFQLVEPLVGAALAAQSPPLRLRRIHRAAVELIEATPRPLTDDETVAFAAHCFNGDITLDERRVAWIGRSATALVSRSRFAEAREQLLSLERALRRSPKRNPGSRSVLPSPLALLLAETLSRSGELDAAEDVLADATGPTGETDIAIALRRARDRVALGQNQEAWEIYAPILAHENPGRDPAITQARIEAASVLRSIGMTDEASQQQSLGASEAQESGNHRLTVEARLSQHRALYAAGRPNEALRFGREAFSVARASGSTPLIARASSAIGAVLCDLRSLERGMRWSRRALRLAEASDDFATVSGAGHRLATAMLDAGDLAGAERMALRIMHLDSDMHRSRALPRPRSLLRVIQALRGESSESPPEAGRFWDGREPLDLSYSLNSEVIAQYTEQLVSGNPEGAHETVSTGIDWFIKAGSRGRFLVCDLIPRQVHAAILMGDLEAAERAVTLLDVARTETEAFAVADGQHHLARGRLAMARLDWAGALPLLVTAAREFGSTGAQWQRMQTLKEAAEVYLSLDDTERAQAVLAECHDFFTKVGARDLQEIRWLYARAGRRPPRARTSRTTGELSEREVEVMRLAARGMTDAQIAAVLHIQRRTVTTHMHHILAKRGIHSRLDLSEANW